MGGNLISNFGSIREGHNMVNITSEVLRPKQLFRPTSAFGPTKSFDCGFTKAANARNGYE